MTIFSWGASGNKLRSPADASASDLASPICKIVLLPTDGTPFVPTRKIIGNIAGTATVKDFAGDTLTLFPITGQEQNLAITAISSLVTTTKVFGLY